MATNNRLLDNHTSNTTEYHAGLKQGSEWLLQAVSFCFLAFPCKASINLPFPGKAAAADESSSLPFCPEHSARNARAISCSKNRWTDMHHFCFSLLFQWGKKCWPWKEGSLEKGHCLSQSWAQQPGDNSRKIQWKRTLLCIHNLSIQSIFYCLV